MKTLFRIIFLKKSISKKWSSIWKQTFFGIFSWKCWLLCMFSHFLGALFRSTFHCFFAQFDAHISDFIVHIKNHSDNTICFTVILGTLWKIQTKAWQMRWAILFIRNLTALNDNCIAAICCIHIEYSANTHSENIPTSGLRYFLNLNYTRTIFTPHINICNCRFNGIVPDSWNEDNLPKSISNYSV